MQRLQADWMQPMRTRSRTSLFVAVALLVGSISACSSSGGSGGSGGGTVNLTYEMFSTAQEPVVRKALAAFEKTHKNIKVTILNVPPGQYRTKLQTQLEGGTSPDVYWAFGGELPLYASGGVAADLSSRIAQDKVDMSAFGKTAVSSVTYNGKVYGFPHSAAVPGLWYNKKLFDAAGLKYPNASWTWSDLTTAAAKLTDRSKGQYGIAAPMNLQSNVYPTIYQAGGTIISGNGKSSTLNSTACAQAVGLWTGLIKSGSSPSLADMVETDPNTMFLSGKVAMLYALNSTADQWDADKTFSESVDVAALPAGPAGQATTLTSVPIIMNAKSTHQDEAWQLMKYLSSPQGLATQAGQGGAMPPAAAAATQWSKNYPQFDTQVFSDELAYAKPYPQSKNTAKWLKDITTAMTPAWELTSSPADACDAAAKVMTSDLGSA
jgi:multiple sugar transport system substrate-binding protein